MPKILTEEEVKDFQRRVAFGSPGGFSLMEDRAVAHTARAYMWLAETLKERILCYQTGISGGLTKEEEECLDEDMQEVLALKPEDFEKEKPCLNKEKK